MDKEKKQMFLALFLTLIIFLGLAGLLLYYNISKSRVPAVPEQAYQDEFSYTLWTKVQYASLTDEEFRDLIQKLKIMGYTADSIKNSRELRRNENGVTYGPDCFGTELISVAADDWTEGYVYRADLEGDMPKSIEEALAVSGQERVIPVYASDGVTVIGTFTSGSGKIKEEEEFH